MYNTNTRPYLLTVPQTAERGNQNPGMCLPGLRLQRDIQGALRK